MATSLSHFSAALLNSKMRFRTDFFDFKIAFWVCDFFVNKKVRDVGCGLRHTVFVLDDGTVYTCGCNDLGQLGHEKSRKKPGKLKIFLFALLIVILSWKCQTILLNSWFF